MSRRVKLGVLATPEGILAGRMLAAMLEAGVTVDAVLLDPTPVSERERAVHEQRTGERLLPLPLAALERHRLPCFFVTDHNGAAALDLIAALGLDLLANAGTPRICRAGLLAATPMGVLNCHPGRLPWYRGACAVEHAVLADEPVANTVHLMNAGIDEGPVLAIEEVSLVGIAGYRDLRVATYQAGFALFARCLRDLQEGRLTAADFTPQGEGRRNGPVDAAALAEVEDRLASGRYRPNRARVAS